MDEEEDESADNDQKIEESRDSGDNGVSRAVSEVPSVGTNDNPDEDGRSDGFDIPLTSACSEEEEEVEPDQ